MELPREALGPVDRNGLHVPLNTRMLYDENGEGKTVLWFRYSPGLNHWMAELDEGPNAVKSAVAVRNLHLDPVDSWEKLLRDFDEALHQGGHPACAYLAARGLCRGDMVEAGKCKLSSDNYCVRVMVSNVRGRIKRLCAGNGED